MHYSYKENYVDQRLPHQLVRTLSFPLVNMQCLLPISRYRKYRKNSMHKKSEIYHILDAHRFSLRVSHFIWLLFGYAVHCWRKRYREMDVFVCVCVCA